MFCRALIILTLLVTEAVRGAELVFDFSKTAEHSVPAGFTNVLAGGGKLGDWRVLSASGPDGTSQPVLAQVNMDVTDERFPLLIYDRARFGDFTITTKFQMVEGLVEQMAGLVFRYQDPNNFYAIRASALGQNVRFYKVVGGIRSNPIGPAIPVKRGVWYELQITCRGNKIRATLNGRDVLPELTDTSFAVGKIGFLTKSDAVSHFADTQITYTPRENLAEVLVRDIVKKYPRLVGLKVYVADETGTPRIVASNLPEEVGTAGGNSERGTIERAEVYYSRTSDAVSVVQPLRDNNGEPIAAVRVLLKPFPGQTEQTVLQRALPIVKEMQTRVRTMAELRGD
jgi:hypothetical protein